MNRKEVVTILAALATLVSLGLSGLVLKAWIYGQFIGVCG